MKNRTNIAPWAIFAALCVGAFFSPWILPWAEAQRTGYVEKTVNGALANQLAPNPAAGLVLTPVGTDTNRVQWATSTSVLPTGTSPGQVLGVVALTATRTVVVTGSQTSTATETYSYTQTTTGTATGTITATGATGTYTSTATGTATGMSTQGSVTVNSNTRGLAIDGNVLYGVDNSISKLQTIDVSNPASMSTSGSFTTCSTPRSVVSWSSSSVFVSCYSSTAQLWNCSTPSACTKTSDISGVGSGSNSAANYFSGGTRSNYILLANSTADAVDVVDVNGGSVVGTVSTGASSSPWGVTAYSLSRGAVSNSGDGTIYVLDYSTPSSPSLLGHVHGTIPYGLASWGGRYIAAADYGANRVHIIDANDPNSPSIIGYVDTGSSTGPWRVSCSGAYCYVLLNTTGELMAIDVSTPGSPSSKGTISVGSNPRGIAVSWPWAYVALWGGGTVKSIDISRFQTNTGTETTTNTQTVTYTLTNTQTTTVTGTQTYTGTSTYSAASTETGTGTGTEWKAVNGALYAGSHVQLSKGTDTTLTTSVYLSEIPKIHVNASSVPIASVLPISDADGLLSTWVYAPVSVETPLLWRYATGTSSATATATSVDIIATRPTLIMSPAPVSVGSVPGGDLFMYPSGNNIMFFDAPNPANTTAYWDVTATTSPSWFTWAGGKQYIEVVNRFAGEGGSPVAYTPTTWISPGVVSYYFSLKASAAVTTHAVFGLCTNGTTLSSTVQDISFSVTSSSWAVFSGTFALSNGLLVPSGNVFCVGFYSQTSSGSATSYIGVNYTNYTRLNGPWIKSGSNSWTW